LKGYERIRQELVRRGLDAIYVHSMINRRFATGFFSSGGLVIITQKNQYYMTDSRYIEAAGNRLPDFDVKLMDADHPYKSLVMEVVEKEGIKQMGFEEGLVSWADYQWLKETFPVELVAAQSVFSSLRAIKQPEELEAMVRAQRIAETALEETLNIIKPGVTEKDIAAELIYRMLKNGADGVSFDPIVVAGTHSSMPHGVPSDTPVKDGDFITMDFGCKKDGYCSDMTRTVAVGSCTDEMKKVYYTVLEAQLAGIAKAAQGVPGCEVHNAAAKVIADAGYGAYFGHGFGHGLGLEVHECNGAGRADETPLSSFNVISAEPGIYLPGRFGVRIEDVIVIHENGCENITRSPKELIIL